VLSNIVSSQVKIHEQYGGVVPELASREHLKNILPVVREALSGHGSPSTISVSWPQPAPRPHRRAARGRVPAKAIAYARNIPSSGCTTAKATSLRADRIPRNRLSLHRTARFGRPHRALSCEGVRFVSYDGQTRDDAAGEAYDKVAKLLDLPYPGGPVLDRLAREGNAVAIAFPRGQRDGFDSASAGSRQLSGTMWCSSSRRMPASIQAEHQGRCRELPAAVVDTLVEKTMLAARETGQA